MPMAMPMAMPMPLCYAMAMLWPMPMAMPMATMAMPIGYSTPIARSIDYDYRHSIDYTIV